MTDIEKRAAEHLGYWSKKPPSAEALRIAVLLERWQGLHHMMIADMEKADWTRFFVEIKWTLGDLATFDFGELTRLVFLAHDCCIRVSIKPSGPRALAIMFHPRKMREGGMTARHPTLEKAVADYREFNLIGDTYAGEAKAQPVEV